MLNYELSDTDLIILKKGVEIMTYTFEYKRLKGRIVEKYGTMREFAGLLGISPAMLTKKMTGRAGFSQADMIRCCNLLDIALKDIGSFFFA